MPAHAHHLMNVCVSVSVCLSAKCFALDGRFALTVHIDIALKSYRTDAATSTLQDEPTNTMHNIVQKHVCIPNLCSSYSIFQIIIWLVYIRLIYFTFLQFVCFFFLLFFKFIFNILFYLSFFNFKLFHLCAACSIQSCHLMYKSVQYKKN